jgi:hypothetical protein
MKLGCPRGEGRREKGGGRREKGEGKGLAGLAGGSRLEA